MYNEKVYSEFEIHKLSIKFLKDTTATVFGCTGSLIETLDQKKVSKKCEGVVTKTRTKGTGTGTLKITLHAKYDILCKALGMNREDLIDGVKAYGENSIHEEFLLTGEVLDEDNIKKLKAYPKCIITNKPEAKITNGDEEVAEVELDVSVMPDDYKEGMYEAICDVSYLEDEEIINSWLTNFTRDLIVKTTEGEEV